MSRTDPTSAANAERPATAWIQSPLLWGALASVALYQALPYTGAWRPQLERYLAGHPLEYAQVFLFLVGLAILAFKSWQLVVERQALRLPLPVLPDDPGSPEAVAGLEESVAALPPRLRDAFRSRRLADLAHYLRHRHDRQGLEAHAQHLAQLAAERQHDDYGQLQTIIWAVPILGFLGTVMGITLAIAHVTPEQLDSSLDSVTSGLAVAFDTTAVALAQSIVLVFAAYFVRRRESQLLGEVDEQVFKGLVCPLAAGRDSRDPLMAAQSEAARDLIARSQSLLTRQTELWRESLEELRQRWSHTLQQQQTELATTLSGGMDASLDSHAGLLERLRTEFLQACRDWTSAAGEQLEQSRAVHAVQQQQLLGAWESAESALRSALEQDRDSRSAAGREFLSALDSRISGLAGQLGEFTAALGAQSAAVTRQCGLLERIVGQEEQLAGLQSRLTENLEALRATETLQQSAHSLTAAIHLLTARARSAA